MLTKCASDIKEMKDNAVLLYPQSTALLFQRQNSLVSLCGSESSLFFTLFLPLIYSTIALAIAGAHSEEDQRAAYLYGTYVGQAFQLIDDALDFEGKIL